LRSLEEEQGALLAGGIPSKQTFSLEFTRYGDDMQNVWRRPAGYVVIPALRAPEWHCWGGARGQSVIGGWAAAVAHRVVDHLSWSCRCCRRAGAAMGL